MTLDDKVKAMGVDIEDFTPSAALAPAARATETSAHIGESRSVVWSSQYYRLKLSTNRKVMLVIGKRFFPGELLSMEFRCKL